MSWLSPAWVPLNLGYTGTDYWQKLYTSQVTKTQVWTFWLITILVMNVMTKNKRCRLWQGWSEHRTGLVSCISTTDGMLPHQHSAASLWEHQTSLEFPKFVLMLTKIWDHSICMNFFWKYLTNYWKTEKLCLDCFQIGDIMRMIHILGLGNCC